MYSLAIFSERYAIGDPSDATFLPGRLFDGHHRLSRAKTLFERAPVLLSPFGKRLKILCLFEVFRVVWRPLLVSFQFVVQELYFAIVELNLYWYELSRK